MSAFAKQWGDVRKQIGDNPRLKWALLLVAVLLLTYTAQLTTQLVRSLQQKSIEAELELRRIRSLRGQNIWIERAKQTDTLLKALSAELPSVSTAGQAQANLQSWLKSVIDTLPNGQDGRFSVDSAMPMEQMADVIKVHATVSVPATPQQMINLLNKMEGSRNLLVIETISVRGDKNGSNTLSIVAYYRLVPARAREDA